MTKLLPFLLLFVFSSGLAQVSATLTLNKKVNYEMLPGQNHRFQIKLKADQFCVVVVQQDGVDLLIKAYDPSGAKLGEFDSPNGKYGPEMVTLISKTTGSYAVEVLPLEANEATGKYSIEVLRIEPKANTPEKMVDQLMSTLTRPGEPGAAVAVAKGNDILFNKGYGSANTEYDVPISPMTVFHIASVSKQFTAFAIATLADQGKISMDDDIRKYLPELNDFGQKITVKQLVHHTSGLRDQWNLLCLAGWRMDDVITKNQVLRVMSRQKELNFKPGDEFSYCNTGYTLTAEIVSRVTSTPFPVWCADNIFKPLGMSNTLFYDDHEKIVKNRAYSFHDSQEGLKKSVLSYANAGATSLFTTTEDLVRWAANFQFVKVGNSKIMARMEERAILNKGDTITYAFGQDVGKYKGLKAVSHGGGDAGFRSYLLRFPEQKYTIVVLSNRATFNPGDLAYKVADIYLKEFLKEEEKKPQAQQPVANAVQVSEDLLKLYSGRYELSPGVIVTCKVENGKLIAQATDQPPVELIPKSETEFLLAPINAKITFKKNSENVVNEFEFNQGGRTLNAVRMADFDATKVDKAAYVGTYYSPELETRYKLTVKNDTIHVEHIRHEPSTLTPLAPDSFSCTAWFMSKLDFTRDEKGQVSGFKASSGRVRNVKFEKVPE